MEYSGFSELGLPLIGGECIGGPARRVASKVPTYISGQRARLQERFMNGGGSTVSDHEILELLLFRALPQQDVKPLARILIDTFGDFNRVLAASPARLRQVEGIGEAVLTDLKLIEAATHRMARARVLDRPALVGWDALLDYCHTTMSHAEIEQFRVLYLDRKNVLILDELQGKGTVGNVPVYPREVLKRALELNASSLILVHNHPSGDPTPSPEDIAMTDEILAACAALRVTLHDHVIIGKSKETSFRVEGYL